VHWLTGSVPGLSVEVTATNENCEISLWNISWTYSNIITKFLNESGSIGLFSSLMPAIMPESISWVLICTYFSINNL